MKTKGRPGRTDPAWVGRGGGSQLSVMACVCKAHVGKPAPEFQATAVVDGAFKEVKLSDYKGEGLDGGRGGGGAQALEGPSPNSSSLPTPFPREVRGPLFLPAGLYLCVPHGDRSFQRPCCGVPQAELRGAGRLGRLSVHPPGLVGMEITSKEGGYS